MVISGFVPVPPMVSYDFLVVRSFLLTTRNLHPRVVQGVRCGFGELLPHAAAVATPAIRSRVG